MPFLILFAVLLLTPRRHLAQRPAPVVQRGAGWSAPPALQLGGGAVLFVALLFVPSFAGSHLTDWTVALAMTILFLSLGLLVRTSGQVSLCHVSFAAIGAVAFSQFAGDAGIPWLPALLLAGLVAVPVGALLSIPAIRLTGLYLALATFGFGILLQFMFYTQDFMFGDSGGIDEPRPASLGIGLDTDAGFYRLVLVLVVLVLIGVVALDRGRLGRLLRGLADSPVALTTNGTSVNITRVLVFCLSAFLAAIAGALVGVANTTASADTYQPLLSLTWFALVVIVAGREPWYALTAAFGLILVPSYFDGADTQTWTTLLFGLTAVGLALLGRIPPVPAPVRIAIDRVFRRGSATPDDIEAPAPAPVERVAPLTLDAEGVRVRFGGLVAVDGLDLATCTGRVTGLIGPNGAGKTTTFDVLSGLRRPTGGAVVLAANDVTRRDAASRARAGVGRTFQRMQLFDSLTVRENVAAGVEGSLAGAHPLRHVVPRRGDRDLVAARAQQALELCELTGLAHLKAGDLSTGQRRLVELARCLAGPYRLLLLDEPSSGLDHVETERFGHILRRVVEERGVGILLVEHDMSLVLGVCDDIYVLDFGKLVFHGTPAEVQASPIVRAAYLGDPEVEDAAEPDGGLVLEGAPR
jgi:ABC-type branched-subunit amino acid transport system ATPase component/ABC-type branched-subunit amino acid transport system permease subunit